MSLFLLFFFFGNLQIIYATDFKPQVSIPGSNLFLQGKEVGVGNTTNALSEYIKAIYTYAISIVGIVATIMLMFGGFVWLTAGGSGDKVGKARDIIFGSLTGLVLALTSYTLLNMINPDLVNFKVLNIDGVTDTGGLKPCLYDKTSNEYSCPDGKWCNKKTLLCTNETDFTKNASYYAWIKRFDCTAAYSAGLPVHFVPQPTNDKCLNNNKPAGDFVCCGVYPK